MITATYYWYFFEDGGHIYKGYASNEQSARRRLIEWEGMSEEATAIGSEEAEQPAHTYEVNGTVGEDEWHGLHVGWWRIVDETGRCVRHEYEWSVACWVAGQMNEEAGNMIREKERRNAIKRMAANRGLYDL